MKEVKIGDQIWMAENLNVDRFRNGDPILLIKNVEHLLDVENEFGSIPAFRWPNDDPSNSDSYGKLYNWDAV